MCWLDSSALQTYGLGTANGLANPDAGLSAAKGGAINLASILGLRDAGDSVVRQAGAGAALRASAGLGRASTFLTAGSLGDTTTTQGGTAIQDHVPTPGPVTNNPKADAGVGPKQNGLTSLDSSMSPIEARVSGQEGPTSSGFGPSGWKNRSILGGP